MRDNQLAKLMGLCDVLGSQQKNVLSVINEISATLKDKNMWSIELGDQLVYLKYFSSSSHSTETQIMLHIGASSSEIHRKEHDRLISSMNGLLAMILEKDSCLSAVIDECTKLMMSLQNHFSKHDRELTACIEKISSPREISPRYVPAAMVRIPSLSMGCCAL